MKKCYAGLLSAIMLLGIAPSAFAHGVLIESTPRARQAVVDVKRLDLRFNSRIEPAFSRVRLVGPSGEPLPLQAVPYGGAEPNRLRAALPELGPGQYTVHWRVLTVDGHVTEGAFSFRVRPGS